MKDSRGIHVLTVPKNAGRTIVETGSLFACPLLATNSFVSYCTSRGLVIDRERLIRLETLRLFTPVFRICAPEGHPGAFHIPPRSAANWFTKGWSKDTTTVGGKWHVPPHTDQTHEAYYSIFQLFHLEIVLAGLRLEIQLEAYVEGSDVPSTDWKRQRERLVKLANENVNTLRDGEHRQAVALLCQHVSNRYFFQTQTDQRTISVSRSHYSDRWIHVNPSKWNWNEEVRGWQPSKIEKLYRLTRDKLRHAYQHLAVTQAHYDPLENWYDLTQFVSIRQRRQLKGSALLSETLKAGAFMLRSLHEDLYDEKLPIPNEVSRTILHHVPELEVRRDVRRHLEFVANCYGVNPQPRLSLIVEGRTEEIAITQIFEQYFGTHPGVHDIEIINLRGVNNATGAKRDRFRAIMRLIDYLHSHQTLVFLILDNENHAEYLQREAGKMRSIHHVSRNVTRTDYIKVWNHSFEFDNFSCTEIARALNQLAGDQRLFAPKDLTISKADPNPGSALKRLYRERLDNRQLNKVKLAKTMIANMLLSNTGRRIENRPIVRTLNRVIRLAADNHLPMTQESSDLYQASELFGMPRQAHSTQ